MKEGIREVRAEEATEVEIVTERAVRQIRVEAVVNEEAQETKSTKAVIDHQREAHQTMILDNQLTISTLGDPIQRVQPLRTSGTIHQDLESTLLLSKANTTQQEMLVTEARADLTIAAADTTITEEVRAKTQTTVAITITLHVIIQEAGIITSLDQAVGPVIVHLAIDLGITEDQADQARLESQSGLADSESILTSEISLPTSMCHHLALPYQRSQTKSSRIRVTTPTNSLM